MCDEVQARLDDSWYPTVDDLPKHVVSEDGEWGPWIKLANGAIYSQHLPCRRYVQTNYPCEWCNNWERFPLRNMVSWILFNREFMGDTPRLKRNIEEKFAEVIQHG